MRTIAIGDIHGMLDKLKALIQKLDLRPSDTLVFLGDYIDRGPDSRGVIDYIIDLRDQYNVITLKGNHEDFALQTIAHPLSKMGGSWMRNGGVACLDSYGVGGFSSFENLSNMEELHGDFLKSLPIFYETDDYIFVHGYLDPNLDLEDQFVDWNLWMRFEDIPKMHKSRKTVVCGHSIQMDGVADAGFKVCIDTGSFLEDGYITAMVIENGRHSFVDSR